VDLQRILGLELPRDFGILVVAGLNGAGKQTVRDIMGGLGFPVIGASEAYFPTFADRRNRLTPLDSMRSECYLRGEGVTGAALDRMKVHQGITPEEFFPPSTASQEIKALAYELKCGIRPMLASRMRDARDPKKGGYPHTIIHLQVSRLAEQGPGVAEGIRILPDWEYLILLWLLRGVKLSVVYIDAEKRLDGQEWTDQECDLLALKEPLLNAVAKCFPVLTLENNGPKESIRDYDRAVWSEAVHNWAGVLRGVDLKLRVEV